MQHSKSDHLKGFELIIDNYEPGGGTNIYAGLQKGYEEIMKDFDPEKANVMIVLTDGYGQTEPKEITNYVAAKYEEGIQFSTIGLGYSYNQALLELIAVNGQGSFGHTDTTVALTDVFLKNVKDAFKFNAKDVIVDLTFNENLEFVNLYGFPIQSESANQISFRIPKVPSGMNYLAFLKFKIKNASVEIESQPIKINVSYFDLVKNENITYEEELSLEWTDETTTELLFDREEQILYAIAIMNQTLKVMAEAHENKDEKSAKKYLKLGMDQVEEIFPDAKPKEIKALFEELKGYLLLFEEIEKK